MPVGGIASHYDWTLVDRRHPGDCDAMVEWSSDGQRSTDAVTMFDAASTTPTFCEFFDESFYAQRQWTAEPPSRSDS